MRRAIWTVTAQSDLEEILYYLSQVSRQAAAGERILAEIYQRVTDYVTKNLPEHSHPSAPDDWRYIRHKRWLIFYRPFDDGIEVMRVVDAVRDLPRQLREN